MRDITKAEMDIILALVKSPEIVYNSHSLSKVVGITSMGTLKILKRLEQEAIVKARKVGKATIYRINFENVYAHRYLALLLLREAQSAPPLVRRWVNELKKIKNASLIILFGSLLEKTNPNDIDILLVTEEKQFQKLQQEIKEINELNIKKIHPLYQTKKDLINNIKKKDQPVLSAIKGIVLKGEEEFLEVYNESRQE